MSKLWALLRASYFGLAVYGAALAVGVTFLLLGPIQFQIHLDFPRSAGVVESIGDELRRGRPGSLVDIRAAPATATDQCGENASRMLISSDVQIFEFPAYFQEVSTEAYALGACGSGFVFSPKGVQASYLIALGSLPVAVAVLWLMAIARRRAALWRRVAGWTPRQPVLAARLAAGCGGAAAMLLSQYAVFGVADLFGLPYSAQGMEATPTQMLVAFAPLTLLAAPVVEEYAFRGIILERYLRHLPASLAIALGAVVFAVPHFPQTPVDFTIFFVVGVVLGILWCKTRSLIAVITAHAVHNAAASILIAVGA